MKASGACKTQMLSVFCMKMNAMLLLHFSARRHKVYEEKIFMIRSF